jgi:hypothetical protein
MRYIKGEEVNKNESEIGNNLGGKKEKARREQWKRAVRRR